MKIVDLVQDEESLLKEVNSFGLDYLQNILYDCLVECNYNEMWIAEDIIMSLAVFMEKSNKQFSLKECFSLIIKILLDHAYGDVAIVLQQKIGVQNDVEKTFESCFKTQINNFDLDDKEKMKLQLKIQMQLQKLGYHIEKVSSNLIREIIVQEIGNDFIKKNSGEVLFQHGSITLLSGGELFYSWLLTIPLDHAITYDEMFELSFMCQLSSLMQTIQTSLQDSWQTKENTPQYLRVEISGLKILHKNKKLYNQAIFMIKDFIKQALENNLTIKYKLHK